MDQPKVPTPTAPTPSLSPQGVPPTGLPVLENKKDPKVLVDLREMNCVTFGSL